MAQAVPTAQTRLEPRLLIGNQNDAAVGHGARFSRKPRQGLELSQRRAIERNE